MATGAGQVAVRFFLPVEGGDESGGVGGIAALDHGIEDEMALTAGEQDFVAVDDSRGEQEKKKQNGMAYVDSPPCILPP